MSVWLAGWLAGGITSKFPFNLTKRSVAFMLFLLGEKARHIGGRNPPIWLALVGMTMATVQPLITQRTRWPSPRPSTSSPSGCAPSRQQRSSSQAMGRAAHRWIFVITTKAFDLFEVITYCYAVLRDRHCFWRLRLRTSEIPEPTPAQAKWGRFRLQAKNGGSRLHTLKFLILSWELWNVNY